MQLLNTIGGRPLPAASGDVLDVVEPATGKVYATVPASGIADVDHAVSAAKEAFGPWCAMPTGQRSECLLRLAGLIERDLDDLARRESVDSGKPVSLARTVDIPRAAANLRFFATAVLHDEGRSHMSDAGAGGGAQGADALNYTLRSPRGVAGCISPWNLPLYLLTWKIAPALATGNTVVAKPSEVTPATASRLAELAGEAGMPDGVLNIVHGMGDAVGAAIVRHPDVPAISFTGSTRVGAWIGATAGEMLKAVSLELGGKNPYIIFGDANLEDAIATAGRAAFANQGQICLCGSRLLAHRDVYDRVVEGVARHASSLRIGDPMDDATQQGAVVSGAHRDKVLSYIERAKALGGTVQAGGGVVPADELPARCRDGCFIRPTVLTGLANDCDVVQEEIFGPVVTIQPFDDEDEAVALANSTEYGLAASVWTNDISRAHRVAARVDSGIVWVNCWMVRDLRTPFGGTRRSGVGREGGTDALRFFTEAKNVCVRL